MDSIFHYKDYKEYVLDYRNGLPSGGRGLFQRLAEALGVVPVIISQIFKGDRELTPEQAVEVCEYLKLSKIETKFFQLLVQKNRAGTSKLKERIKEELEEIKRESLELSSQLPKDAKLDEKTKALFYSNWIYSAVRICTDIDALKTIDQISHRLDLPKDKVLEVAQFLLKAGLIVTKDQKFSVGPHRTHLESNSPWVRHHHQNWRSKSLEKMMLSEKTDLFYTGPMTLSRKDFLDIRENLAKTISDVIRVVSESKSEDLFCLNLDWFRMPGKTK
jgi:uncharacterized protein (TIGR02147 family)